MIRVLSFPVFNGMKAEQNSKSKIKNWLELCVLLLSLFLCVLSFLYLNSCFTDDGMVNMNEVIDKGSLFTGESLIIPEHLLRILSMICTN